MAEPIPADEQSNYETFRDCLSEPVLKLLAAPSEKPKSRKRRHVKKSSKAENNLSKEANPFTSHSETKASDAEDLGEFIEYLSTLIFPFLPHALRTLTYPLYTASPALQETYSTPLSASTYTSLLDTIPPTALDTLSSYALLPTPSDPISLRNLLLPVLASYITSATAAPPIWTTTRTSACELCARDWVPLTYHHLIPKSVHERVRKRGWHSEDQLGSVAWLCRACHSFVHGLAGNEGLARRFWTVELIRKGGVEEDGEVREKVEGWVRWVGGVRWKSR